MKSSICLSGIVGLVVASCSTSTRSDGPKHEILCDDYVKACYERAIELCPEGYHVTNRVRPQRQGDGATRYRLNIRCRPKVSY